MKQSIYKTIGLFNLAYIIFVFFSLVLGITPLFLSVLSIWIYMFRYSFKNLKNNLLLFAFLITFFIFLIGGHFVYEYFNMKISYFFDQRHYYHSNLLIGLSLVFIFIGNLLAKKILSIKLLSNVDTNGSSLSELQLIRRITKILYIVTYPLYCFITLDRVVFTLLNSYLESYTGYEREIPFVIASLAAMTPYFLFLFLATNPSKKEAYPLILMQIFYAITTLLTGRRTDFAITMFFVIIYFIYRDLTGDGVEKWISKKYIKIGIVIIPFMLIFLFLYRYLRHGMNLSELSLKQIFLGFFQQQGFSSSVIRLGYHYENVLRDDTYYSFFGLVKFSRTNSIIRLFYRPDYGFSYIGNSVEFALNGNSLSHALSYHALKNYLKGWGVGSCYIAELYKDFSFTGVILGNLIFGLLIKIIDLLMVNKSKYSVFIRAICFSLVEPFLRVPRWNFDIVFTEFLSLGMWSAFFSVYMICFIFKHKDKAISLINNITRR